MFITQTATSVRQIIALIVNAVNREKIGRVSYVVTAKGDEVKTAFSIVDASELIISNHLDGRINEAYPQELQPRDRTRLSSKLQVNEISKNLRPAQLSDSGLSSHGAPIIGSDNVVESGNGRSMGVIKAYASGNAGDYKEYLVKNAKLYGLSASKIADMERPVLVRVRLDDIDRAKFAKDSNLSDLQDMAASEKAFVDAESISGGLLALFAPSETGNLMAGTNSAFVQGFMKEIGASAAAGLLTDDGRPTRQLLDRIQNAIFAKAYKNESLVKLVAEEPDPELRNVLTALNVAAHDFVQMQYLSGEAHKTVVDNVVQGVESVESLDGKALQSLTEAIELVRKAKDSGQSIEELVSQQGLFSSISEESAALAIFIVKNNRSAKRMGKAFKLMAEAINEQLTRQQQAAGDLFGGGVVTMSDVLSSVGRQLESEFGEINGLTGLFESAPASKLGVFSQAKSTNELIKNIVGLTTRSSYMMGNYVGQWIQEIKNGNTEIAPALKAIKSVLGKSKAEFSKNVTEMDSFSEGVASIIGGGIMRYAFKEDFIKAVVIDGNGFELKANYKAYTTANTPAEKHGAAKALLDSIDPFLVKRRGRRIFTADSKAMVNALTGSQEFPSVITLYAEANNMPDSLKMPEQDALAAHQNIIVAGKAIMPNMDEKVEANREVIRNAAVDVEFKEKLIGVGLSETEVESISKALQSSRMGYGNFKGDGYQIVLNTAPAIIRREVSGLITKLLEPTREQLKQGIDALVKLSPATDENADEWISGLKISKALISRYDVNYGSGAFLADLKWAYKLAGGRLSTLKEIGLKSSGRSYAQKIGKIALNPQSPRATLAHELGHHFEYSNPKLLDVVKVFLNARKPDDGGAPLIRLRVATGNAGYRKNEIAIRDSLSSPYIGKVYSTTGKVEDIGTSEVFSSAFEYMFNENDGAKSMLNNDGLIEFAMGAIKGVFDGNY
ncbi:hypothetical protein [Yersinia ruckeri]|uniref:hypothetical protein n=1 Tax=Yersinia ruckeri TaxID=29486 RepID=UPI002237C3A8|nr:hypothetical protein [Yersinia ruckeri]MCW6615836.1 hypothetical protein [Yersinia ruckeri]